VRGVYDEVRRLGGDVLVVSFSPPRAVARYLERYPLPFPVVSDPERTAYRAFALGRTTWRDLLSPRSILRYLGLIFRGWLPWKTAKDDDLLQLGGDFVLDRTGCVVYAHASGEATDRPRAAELLAALKKVGVTSGEPGA
jgi:hypothetical protein